MRALKEVGQLLVDVNGQHAALSLKDPATRVSARPRTRARTWPERWHERAERGTASSPPCCWPAPNQPACLTPLHPITPAHMQLRLLDRLAGTSAAADAFAGLLAEWQAAAAQLRELDALGDQEQRAAMQQLVDEVRPSGWLWLAAGGLATCGRRCSGRASARGTQAARVHGSACSNLREELRRLLLPRLGRMCRPRAWSAARSGACAGPCASWTAGARRRSAAAWWPWASGAAPAAAVMEVYGPHSCCCRGALLGGPPAAHPSRARSLLACALPRSGDGGGGIADALRDVQLQVKQLLSQEERLAAAELAAKLEEDAAAAAASGTGGRRRAAAAASDDDFEPTAGASTGDEDDEGGEDGEGTPAGMLRSTLGLLDEARALLDEAEERVAAYGRRYRFSEAEYRELSSRLQEVRCRAVQGGAGWGRAAQGWVNLPWAGSRGRWAAARPLPAAAGVLGPSPHAACLPARPPACPHRSWSG